MNTKPKKLYGIGINDSKTPVTVFVNDRRTSIHAYQVWSGLLRRCYCPTFQAKFPTYHGCTVAPEWHSFTAFHEWYKQQGDVSGLQLDKDILSGDAKQYGPETCVFVPRSINLFLRERKDALTGSSYDKVHKRFKASCNGIAAGYYDTAIEAHHAWKKAKLASVHQKKEEFDAVDLRIYPALVERYSITQ